MPIGLGSDLLADAEVVRNRRLGLVCNPASVDRSWQHIADRVASVPGATLAALFGPQHGFRSAAQDNMIETPHSDDPRRRVPVYSLYSETREPTPAMLATVDVLVMDLQDVGTRVYTYAYTMANCLRAAKRLELPVVVCDRPNPIGGEAVEGPVLQPGYESFVGQFPLPLRHGLTIGELARLFNEHFGIGAALTVLPLRGWRRSMYYDETGLPWVMPSPNLPTLDSAFVYPGTVLLEGTNVSEGRGTTRPFEIVGAPWVDAELSTRRLNSLGLAGVRFRPVQFEPTFQKHARTICGGCQIHVLDRRQFRPVLTGVAVLQEFRRAGAGRFAWREPPYEYETARSPIDLLAGSPRLREQIDADDDAARIARSWEPEAAEFRRVREKYLLY